MSNRHSEVRPRERLISAAYDLFSKDGISQVGIDTVLAKSGCAKASLYSNFKNKVELAIAFLDRREAIWTRGWLESEIKRRAKTPENQLFRAIVRGLAEEANLQEPETFAQAWHMLMKGSIVSAGEGNRNAARDAKRAARRFDYAAIGTVSNVASRLCDEAKPGQILISARVLTKVEDAVKVETVGEFELKGIRRPLAAYNVVGAVGSSG